MVNAYDTAPVYSSVHFGAELRHHVLGSVLLDELVMIVMVFDDISVESRVMQCMYYSIQTKIVLSF